MRIKDRLLEGLDDAKGIKDGTLKCEPDAPYYAPEESMGSHCLSMDQFQQYLYHKKTGTTPTVASPEPVKEECSSLAPCPTICAGTLLITQTCSGGRCIETQAVDCKNQGNFSTCVSGDTGVSCSPPKDCLTNNDCSPLPSGGPSCRGNTIKVEYRCTPNYHCERSFGNCEKDFGQGYNCVEGFGCRK